MERISISGVRQIELIEPDTNLYLVSYINDPSTHEQGIVDSIFHDGPHKTTFTVTFTKVK